MRKKLQKMAVIAALLPLALALAVVTVSCPNPDDGVGNATVVEGNWESGGQSITFSGSSFTWTTEGRLDYKGTLTLSGDGTINFTITQYSDDGGNTWYSESQFIDTKAIAQVGQSVWNLATETMKETLRTPIRRSWGTDLIKTAAGEYNLILDGKQLKIIYAGTGTEVSRTVVYQKAGTSTVAAALVGKWVLESAPTVIVLDFSTNQLRLRRDTTTYTYYTLETDGKIAIGTNPGVFPQDFCTSYTTTGDILTFTGGSSANWYPSASFKKYVFPPFAPTPLTADQWEDGVIGSAAGEAWYSFPVTNETTYRLWWNDSDSGNSTKTLDVRVSAYYSDGTAISNFTDVDSAWTAAQSFTASSSGTVYIKVAPKTFGETGSFDIAYGTGTGKPTVTLNPPGVIALTIDQWKDGEFTVNSDEEAWYSLSVTSGNTYYVWWNDDGRTDSIGGGSNTVYHGNRTKTLDITVDAFYQNGDTVRISTNSNYFLNFGSAWSSPVPFTPTADSTVYLRVKPAAPGNTGTYGIAYRTASTRPAVPIAPANSIALTVGEWERGEITSASNGEAWYSFTVTNETRYYLWWDDSNDGNTMIKKTLDVRVSAWYGSTGDNIFYNQDTGWWTNAQSITPTSNDTVYVKVYPTTSGNTGTFGIVYGADSGSYSDVMPTVPFGPNEPPNPITLTAGEWKDGEITTPGGVVWYSVNVTANGTHYLWWNQTSDNGDGTKTLSIEVDAYNSDGTPINGLYYNAWSSPSSITVTADTTYYLRIKAYSSSSNIDATGTFGIVYNTTNTRPPAPIDLPTATELTAGQWADGEMTGYGSSRTAWFSFTVTAGTTYYVWMNRSDGGTKSEGDGSKTLTGRVSAYYADGTPVVTNFPDTGNFVNVDGIYDTPRNFTPNATQAGKVYIKVTPYNASSTGTFGIVYNTNGARPTL